MHVSKTVIKWITLTKLFCFSVKNDDSLSKFLTDMPANL